MCPRNPGNSRSVTSTWFSVTCKWLEFWRPCAATRTH
jgi:hypothetical protein